MIRAGTVVRDSGGDLALEIIGNNVSLYKVGVPARTRPLRNAYGIQKLASMEATRLAAILDILCVDGIGCTSTVKNTFVRTESRASESGRGDRQYQALRHAEYSADGWQLDEARQLKQQPVEDDLDYPVDHLLRHRPAEPSR